MMIDINLFFFSFSHLLSGSRDGSSRSSNVIVFISTTLLVLSMNVSHISIENVCIVQARRSSQWILFDSIDICVIIRIDFSIITFVCLSICLLSDQRMAPSYINCSKQLWSITLLEVFFPFRRLIVIKIEEKKREEEKEIERLIRVMNEPRQISTWEAKHCLLTYWCAFYIDIYVCMYIYVCRSNCS